MLLIILYTFFSSKVVQKIDKMYVILLTIVYFVTFSRLFKHSNICVNYIDVATWVLNICLEIVKNVQKKKYQNTKSLKFKIMIKLTFALQQCKPIYFCTSNISSNK